MAQWLQAGVSVASVAVGAQPHGWRVWVGCADPSGGRHRVGSRRRPVTAAAPVLSVVDTCTEELHLVPVDAVGLHRRSGCYPALCGAVVPAASLMTVPVRNCRDCAQRARGHGGSAALPRKPVRGGIRVGWSGRGGRNRERRG